MDLNFDLNFFCFSSNTEERAQAAETRVSELEVELRDTLDKLRALEKKNLIDMSLIDPPVFHEKTKPESEMKVFIYVIESGRVS